MQGLKKKTGIPACSNIACPGQVLFYFLSIWVGRWFVWDLLYQVNETETLLARQENLLVLDNWRIFAVVFTIFLITHDFAQRSHHAKYELTKNI